MHHSNAKKIFPILQIQTQRGTVLGYIQPAQKPPNRSVVQATCLTPSLCSGRLTVILHVGNETPEMPSLGAVLQMTLRLTLNLLPLWEGPEILEMEEEDV